MVIGHAHRCRDAGIVHALFERATILVRFAPFEDAFVVVAAPTGATIYVLDTFQNLALKIHTAAARTAFCVNHTFARKLTHAGVRAGETFGARSAIGALGGNWEALTVFARETFGTLVVGHALILRDTGVCNAAKSCRTITVLAAFHIGLADVLNADQTRIEAVGVLGALHRNTLSVHAKRGARAIGVLFTNFFHTFASVTCAAWTLRVLRALAVIEANPVNTRFILRAIQVFFTFWRTDSLNAARVRRTLGIFLTFGTLHAFAVLANFTHATIGVGFADLWDFTIGAETVFAGLSRIAVRLVKTKVRCGAEVRYALRALATFRV